MNIAEMLFSSPLKVDINKNWTQDENGTENSSKLFKTLVDEIDRLIRSSAYSLINGQTKDVARLILAQLAHQHGMRI